MLPTLCVPSKKSTPEQQMAMMRTYLNQLKDDTEGELYNIRWDNLSKPLQDKIDALDRDVVALQDSVVTAEWVNANTITANTLDSYLVNSYYLNSQYVYAGTVAASQIAAGQLSSGVIYAGSIDVAQLSGGYIDASHIDAAEIRAGLVVANDLYTTGNVVARGHLSATEITSKFSSSESSVFNRINLGTLPYSNTTSSLRINVGQTYANVYLRATNIQGQYYLVVNMPS